MQSKDRDDLSVVTGTDSLTNSGTESLEQALAAERLSLAAAEQALKEARERCEALRRRVRELEAEVQSRRTRDQDRAPDGLPERARRKRSTTGVDALLGRDGVDPDRPLAEFRFLSLQRQEVLLGTTRDRAAQRIRFSDPNSGLSYEAKTFGEARQLSEMGYAQGRPKDPLQRHEVWYVEEERPGRLRLDQIFVEHGVEEI